MCCCVQVFLKIVDRNVRDMLHFGLYAVVDAVKFPFHILAMLSLVDTIRISLASFLWQIVRFVSQTIAAFSAFCIDEFDTV